MQRFADHILLPLFGMLCAFELLLPDAFQQRQDQLQRTALDAFAFDRRGVLLPENDAEQPAEAGALFFIQVQDPLPVDLSGTAGSVPPEGFFSRS